MRRHIDSTGVALQKEKVRIFALARELGMESKALLALCQEHGIDVKNQLSTLEPDQRDAVEQLVKRGGGGVALAALCLVYFLFGVPH